MFADLRAVRFRYNEARWLVRHGLHEARHHTNDITAVGRPVPR
jgi:hypothetical protein